MSILIALLNVAGCKSNTEGDGQAPAAPSADLEAIKLLHQKDAEASKKWDVDTLVSLWTDDVVSLFPEMKPVVGKEANRNLLLRLKQEGNGSQITEYNFNFSEVRVSGDWAYEWGTLDVAEIPAGETEAVRSSIKLMRILKREGESGWKVARTIFNGGATGEAAPK
jgi:ketosteroid isomerase-like protein